MTIIRWQLSSRSVFRICQINSWHDSGFFSLIKSQKILKPPSSFFQSDPLKKLKLKRNSDNSNILIHHPFKFKSCFFKSFYSSLNNLYLFMLTKCKRSYFFKRHSLCKYVMEIYTWPDAFISSMLINLKNKPSDFFRLNCRRRCL